MPHHFDGLRLVTVILSLLVLAGMLYVGLHLRNTRQWGCYCVALYATGSVVGNWQRIEQTPTLSTYITFAANICGLLYCMKVMTEPGWREKASH